MDLTTIGQATTSRLGFGCMRFPVDAEGAIDFPKTQAMIDRAIQGGITYFDTAYPYHEKASEPALAAALSAYPRNSYLLATKLPCWTISSLQQAIDLVHLQLERLQTDYVDFYLLHAVNKTTWRKMVDLGVVSALEELQRQGKILQLGFSFHDSYAVFEEIMSYRKWDFCQVQLNYMDIDHQAGMKGYHLAEKLGVPLVIMEPLRGGMLATLPDDIASPMTSLAPQRSVASWGMRWLTSLPNVKVVLSGMSTMEQLEDNLSSFSPCVPLSPQEQEGVAETTRRIRQKLKNGCTSCRYCLPCPAGVDIPANFRAWNATAVFGPHVEALRVAEFITKKTSASQCIGCGKCETHCPQNIPIRDHLKQVTLDLAQFQNV